jgi:hypothetical protein
MIVAIEPHEPGLQPGFRYCPDAVENDAGNFADGLLKSRFLLPSLFAQAIPSPTEQHNDPDL